MSKAISFSSLTVEDIMTANVHSVRPSMTVGECVQLLIKEKISGAPVADQAGLVISVVSEGDLLKLTASGGLEQKIASCLEKLVKTENLLTLKRTDTCVDAYKTFLKHSVHRLIVCDSNGRLQGIVTRSNILKVFIASEKTKTKPVDLSPSNSEPKPNSKAS